jgi:2OG-Fe(II) oxygenase superfamily
MRRTAPPFCLDAQQTEILAPAAAWRDVFAGPQALVLEGVIAPEFCTKLEHRAAATSFIDDDVPDIGTRRVESPQRVGAALSLLLARPALLRWLEEATGIGPLRATAGRLVETHANGRDALNWHSDMGTEGRMLGVVINLSDQPFVGGRFDMRVAGAAELHFSYQHDSPGSMLIFAVNNQLEHRVTPLISGGPRRVYAGWFLSRPEHGNDALHSGSEFS